MKILDILERSPGILGGSFGSSGRNPSIPGRVLQIIFDVSGISFGIPGGFQGILQIFTILMEAQSS